MEFIVKNMNVYQDVIGCRIHDRDIMISASTEDEPFIDLFLTKEQAFALMEKIEDILISEASKSRGVY